MSERTTSPVQSDSTMGIMTNNTGSEASDEAQPQLHLQDQCMHMPASPEDEGEFSRRYIGFSSPQDIIKPPSMEQRPSEKPSTKFWLHSPTMRQQWSDEIESRLLGVMNADEGAKEPDDGYNSGGQDDEDEGMHGEVFLLDEEMFPSRMLPNDFPNHLFQQSSVIRGPNVLDTDFSVQEYEELTSKGRCRHSANMRVHPKELTTIFQRVAEYMDQKIREDEEKLHKIISYDDSLENAAGSLFHERCTQDFSDHNSPAQDEYDEEESDLEDESQSSYALLSPYSEPFEFDEQDLY